MTKDIDWAVVSDDLASSAAALTEDCIKAEESDDSGSAATFATTASVCAYLALAIIRGINAAKDSSHEGTLQ